MQLNLQSTNLQIVACRFRKHGNQYIVAVLPDRMVVSATAASMERLIRPKRSIIYASLLFMTTFME